MYNEDEIDFTKLRYVLYARKSTDDPQRQVRSIPDQIAECVELAKRLRLNVVTILQEKKSAKKPHQRPIFTQMIKDIRAGVYDAVLSWNPDRLSRNMFEAGMLIDMVDTKIIKDFKFVTHPFERSANGLMLLGMSFVLSKQYSDDLSQKVTRGVRRNFGEGKSAAPKHGYIRDKNGMYRPDDKNFELICEAWLSRRDGKSLEFISDEMNSKGYGRVIKKTGRKVIMNPKILSEVFEDPIYYGVLIQARQTVDLREIYDFEPATTEEIYNEVQQLSHRRQTPLQTKKRVTYYPLKMMVQCAFCGHNMVVGASTSEHGKKYLFYRCDDKVCRKEKRRIDPKTGKPKRSIRGIKVFEFIYTFLEEGLNFTEKEYSEYYENLSQLAEGKREELQRKIHSAEASLKFTTSELKDRALGLVNITNERAKKENEKRIVDLEAEEADLKAKITKWRQLLTTPEQDSLTLEQFLNLSKNAADIVKSGDEVQKDIICREIFLNFSVDTEKVLSYQLKPPFDELLKYRQLLPSRTEAKELEPLVASIVSHWKTNCFSFDNLALHDNNVTKGINDIGITYQY